MITILGSFIADLTFRSGTLPAWGETVLGSSFTMGPGGKGANQAVAAARLGARVTFLCKLGRDAFGDLARRTFAEEGIDTRFVSDAPDHTTGAASVVVHDTRGENAIVVVPGSGFEITCADLDRARDAIAESAIFMTQLEVPIPVVRHSLALARGLGVPTLLNPAPAQALPADLYPLSDYFTPNEVEAASLAGHAVTSPADAERAAARFLSLGVGNVVVTLGAVGAVVSTPAMTEQVAAFDAGPVLETTGAGDAFNGAFAVALSEGKDVVEATRFGCAAAGISVTRHGTSRSMPARDDVEALLRPGDGRQRIPQH